MAIGQICYNILQDATTNPVTIPENFDIYSDICRTYRDKKIIIKQLSVTASPGTKFIIDNSQEVIVGRTGVYEINDINISALNFVRPVNYTKDPIESDIESGINKMEEGLGSIPSQFKKYIPDSPGGTTTADDSDWEEDPIKQLFNAVKKIEEGYFKYMHGLHHYEVDDRTGELSNVIVDFLYEIAN